MRVWFNRTFSSVHTAIDLIRKADGDGRFHLIYSNPNRYVPAATVAHQFFVEPTGLIAAAYVDWCLGFCREHRIDIFIPGKEATTLAGQHGRFAEIGTRVLSSAAPEQLALMHDKARFYAEVPCPAAPVAEFRSFHNLAEFDAAYAALRARHAKLCVKPSRSVFGLGFAVLDEERSSAALLMAGIQYHIGLEDMRRGLAGMGDESRKFSTMLLMEYLEGREYSVDCVGDHGKLVAAVSRKKGTEQGHAQRIDMRPAIIEATTQLCAHLGLNGNFNVQFREAGGQPRLLEINPRMSGGIGMACAAGPNLPYIALRGFADGFDTVTVPPVRDGARVTELSIPVELA
jgi:carbamoylphosphate synthase large subunit